MKNLFIVFLGTVCVLLCSCSQMDESLDIAKDMQKTTKRMEQKTNEMNTGMGLAGCYEKMGEAQDEIETADSDAAKMSVAGKFIAAMPYQQIKIDDQTEREDYIFQSVTMFFTNILMEYMDVETGETKEGKEANLRAFTTVINYKSQKQEEFNYEVPSLLEVLMDIVDYGKKLEQGTVLYENVPAYIQELLRFENAAQQMLQYTHNQLSIISLAMVVDLKKAGELAAGNALVSPSDLVKKTNIALDNQTKDFLTTSQKIINFLKENNIEVNYDKQVTGAYKMLAMFSQKKNKSVETLSEGTDEQEIKLTETQESYIKLHGELAKHAQLISNP